MSLISASNNTVLPDIRSEAHKMKEKETEYQKKIANYSPSTLRLLIRMNDTEKQTLKKHEIVMRSKTEQELLKQLKKIQTKQKS